MASAQDHENPQDVCFNGCSGHGSCKDFVCTCDAGYTGTDCKHSLLDTEDGSIPLPLLSTGHFHLSPANYTTTLMNVEGSLLVIFMSPSCLTCHRFELEYAKTFELLPKLSSKVSMARVNADKHPDLLKQSIDNIPAVGISGAASGPTSLPAIILYRPKNQKTIKKKVKVTGDGVLYVGPHESGAIVEFIMKQLSTSLRRIKGVEEMKRFIDSPFLWRSGESATTTTSVSVMGIFSDAEGLEEDEMEDLKAVAKSLHGSGDVYIAYTNGRSDATHAKDMKWIDRTPAIILARSGEGGSGSGHHIEMTYLDALADGFASLTDWIVQKSVPLVGYVTPANFALYERIGLPMVMLFLDFQDDEPSMYDSYLKVSGVSGGIPNVHLVTEMAAAAEEHRGRFSFVYASGVALADSMKTLGLYGGRAALPQVALNLRGAPGVPLPANLGINKETLLSLCAVYTSKGAVKQDAVKALVGAPLSAKNKPKRLPKEAPRKVEKGTYERFEKGDAVLQLSSGTFDKIAMDESKDVLILFHTEERESSGYITPYYKQVAKRFSSLGIESVIIAAMDLTTQNPGASLETTLPTLPAILLLPASAKGPPYRWYSGVGKTGPIMTWVEEHASIRFKLPPLAHLPPEDVARFKEQVTAREQLRAEL